MAIVNFSLPKTLERRVAAAIKEKGFASKAEFFRFAAVHFLDVIHKPFLNEDDRLAYLTNILSRELRERYRGKKLPSAREQLAE